MKKIRFIPNIHFYKKLESNTPVPAKKRLPRWFVNAKRYLQHTDHSTGETTLDKNRPSWKACPALYDFFTTGYFLTTPCDIEIKILDSEKQIVEVLDKTFINFVKPRGEIPEFEVPYGYSPYHFVWLPEWDVELPNGYSAIYMHPANRYDLPFLSTSGIIDNDSANFSGHLPFFVRSGWSGIIPAGTPYMQIIPFKREDWESEILDPESIQDRFKKHSNIVKRFRSRNSGVYSSEVWERRKYL